MAGNRWGALPQRAYSDTRLTAAHYRILGTIACHDGMTDMRKQGAGCYASNETLAKKANVQYGYFSTLVNQLGQLGYVRAAPHPLSKRTRVYRVIYEDDTSKISEPSPPPPADECSKTSEESPQTVRTPKQQPVDSVEVSQDIIFSETELDSAKQKNSSVESAPLASLNGVGLRKQPDKNVGGFLAIVERELKEGAPLDTQTQRYIEQIVSEFDSTDPLYCQAERILETWGATP